MSPAGRPFDSVKRGRTLFALRQLAVGNALRWPSIPDLHRFYIERFPDETDTLTVAALRKRVKELEPRYADVKTKPRGSRSRRPVKLFNKSRTITKPETAIIARAFGALYHSLGAVAADDFVQFVDQYLALPLLPHGTSAVIERMLELDVAYLECDHDDPLDHGLLEPGARYYDEEHYLELLAAEYPDVAPLITQAVDAFISDRHRVAQERVASRANGTRERTRSPRRSRTARTPVG